MDLKIFQRLLDKTEHLHKGTWLGGLELKHILLPCHSPLTSFHESEPPYKMRIDFIFSPFKYRVWHPALSRIAINEQDYRIVPLPPVQMNIDIRL